MAPNDEYQRRERRKRDATLASGVLRGDADAIRALGERLVCVEAFARSMNRRSGNPLSGDRIDDLAQDVVVEVIRRLGTYEARASLETWVFTIVRGRFLNCLRSDRNAYAVSALAWDLEAPEEEELWVTSQAIRDSLAELPADLAEPVRRRTMGGESLAAIARSLGLPVNTVKSRYYRALKLLRRRLGSTAVDPESMPHLGAG